MRLVARFLKVVNLNSDILITRKYLPKYYGPCKNGEGLILVESFQPYSNILAMNLALPLLSKHLNSKLVGYYMTPTSFKLRISMFLRHKTSFYNNFGCREFFIVPFLKSNESMYLEKALEIISKVSDPSEFEKLAVHGVRIGDLVYDQYLRGNQSYTLKLDDKELAVKLSLALCYLDYWIDYFKKNNVKAVCVSHTVYSLAIPARVALKFGVKAFQITATRIERITSDELHAYTDWLHYPEVFKQIPVEISDIGKVIARSRLESRFSGKVGVDMFYSKSSAFTKNAVVGKLIENSNRVKILVAVHDFYDSPHGGGDHFYPDFYIWLEALGKISKQTEYDWYIKTHPDLRPVPMKLNAIANFIREYPDFKLLNANVSHLDLIEQGIDVALTVYGTVGLEYPYLGKITINASLNNPHSKYNFSITPKNREEYESILLNLETLKHEIDKNEILEYYFMHNIFALKSWIFPNIEKTYEDLGSYLDFISIKLFKYFHSGVNVYPIEEISNMIMRYLESGEKVLSRWHLDPNLESFAKQMRNDLGKLTI